VHNGLLLDAISKSAWLNPERLVSRGENAGESKDADQPYDLILKDKAETFVSRAVRFIFSALGAEEGMGQSNVFNESHAEALRQPQLTASTGSWTRIGAFASIANGENRVDGDAEVHKVNV